MLMTFPSEIFDRCWRFIRGDIPVAEFEKWVYETTELEALFSEEFYFILISTDYSSIDHAYVIKEKLEEVLTEVVSKDCFCHTLSNVAAVSMGQHEHIFKSLDEKARFGKALWWLWLANVMYVKTFG